MHVPCPLHVVVALHSAAEGNVIVTDALSTSHRGCTVVHLSVTVPTPCTDVDTSCALEITADPDTTLHVPIIAVPSDIVALTFVVPFVTTRLGPALTTGAAMRRTVAVLLEVSASCFSVHVNDVHPTASPLALLAASVGFAITTVLPLVVHVPPICTGALPANVIVLAHVVVFGPAIDCGTNPATAVLTGGPVAPTLLRSPVTIAACA